MVQMSEVARQRAAFVASGQADCAPCGHPEVDREFALSMATDDYICLRAGQWQKPGTKGRTGSAKSVLLAPRNDVHHIRYPQKRFLCWWGLWFNRRVARKGFEPADPEVVVYVILTESRLSPF